MVEQEPDRYWKGIINLMNNSLMVVRPDGTIMMVNRAFEEMIGLWMDELIGQPRGVRVRAGANRLGWGYPGVCRVIKDGLRLG
jgi:PAS domain-containing protein